MEFSFLYPRFLLLLLLVPFFVFVYFFSIIYNKKKAVLFANFEAMERFYDIEFFSKNFMALYMNLLVLVLLIFSLCGTAVSFNADSSAFSYVVAIDVSSSMSSNDIIPNRLVAAKDAAKFFVDSLPVGVEIGVLEFSGDAQILHVLDSNKLKVKMAIDSVGYGDVQGTNIYNALITADKLFPEDRLKSVILISDGQLNAGDAPQIIKYIIRNDLLINSIAIGTTEGGMTNFDMVSRVDEDFLKSLAFNSGGQFYRVEEAGDFSSLSSSLVEKTNKVVTIDLTFYFLLGAVFLFSLLWILYCLRFKVVP